MSLGKGLLIAGVGVTALATAAFAQYNGYGPGMMQGYGGGYGGGYGPGMMQGYGGGYGPGMMRGYGRGYGPGMRQGYGGGYGPGMMDGYGPDARADSDQNVSADDVKNHIERWLQATGQARLKVGDVKDRDSNTIQADVVTKKENALVDRFVVDRRTGRYQRNGD